MNEESGVDCAATAERLPFLPNGSLDAAERELVHAHLAGCVSCRDELQATRRAREVFAAHLPSVALVELAFGREPAGLDPALVRRHLAACAECRSDLTLARESRALESETPIETRARETPRARPTLFRSTGLAASLVAAFGAGVLYRATRDERRSAPVEAERRRLEARVGDLEGETRRLRAERADLTQQVDRLRAPLPNVLVAELLPADSTQRSPGAAPRNEVRLPGETDMVVFLLAARASGREAAVEIRAAQGAVVWRGKLVPSPLGGYSVGVPAALLKAGLYAIVVRPSPPGPVEELHFRLRQDR